MGKVETEHGNKNGNNLSFRWENNLVTSEKNIYKMLFTTDQPIEMKAMQKKGPRYRAVLLILVFEFLPDMHFAVGQPVTSLVANHEVIDAGACALHINGDQGIGSGDVKVLLEYPASFLIEDGNGPS